MKEFIEILKDVNQLFILVIASTFSHALSPMPYVTSNSNIKQ